MNKSLFNLGRGIAVLVIVTAVVGLLAVTALAVMTVVAVFNVVIA